MYVRLHSPARDWRGREQSVVCLVQLEVHNVSAVANHAALTINQNQHKANAVEAPMSLLNIYL